MDQERLKQEIKRQENRIKNMKLLIRSCEKKIKDLCQFCEHKETAVKTEVYETEYDGTLYEDTTVCLLCNKIVNISETY